MKTLTYKGRITKNEFGAMTDLLEVKGDGFREIFQKILAVVDKDAGKRLKDNEELIKKYYQTDDLNDLQYMEVVGTSTVGITKVRDHETRFGNWSKQEDGKTHYLRAVNKETGEMTFWTE